MKIDSDRIKQLRQERQWSQSQLGDACGLTLRTVQRLENEGRGSMESVRALASVFEIDPDELMIIDKSDPELTPFSAVRRALVNFADFSGVATRAEYWWFLLFVALVTGAMTIMAERLYQLSALVLLLPLIAVGTRRLNDNNHSAWWQALFLVPFGFIPVLYLMAEAPRSEVDAPDIA